MVGLSWGGKDCGESGLRRKMVNSVWGLQTQHIPNSPLCTVVQLLGRQQEVRYTGLVLRRTVWARER